MMYDVVIIGAGVSGSSIARELSRYEANVCVLEKGSDVCEGTSKANSAIVHAGFDAMPGTLMAKLNVQGNQMMDELARDLEIPFKRNGALVVCIHKEARQGLDELLERGKKNGVPDLKILSRDEALEKEPNLADETVAALYAPTSGIICPFILTTALAENAFQNGVEFRFNTKVEAIEKTEDGFLLRTNNGSVFSRYVVNAAGVYADTIHNMVSEHKIKITPRRGDYCLLDKEVGNHVTHTIFPQPTKLGKGVLVSPTIHGNLIVGPTAIDIENKSGTATTKQGLDDLIAKANAHVKNLPLKKVITSFAGLRAHEEHHEFIIEEVSDAPQFIDCAAIESPGLSSSPAIGKMVGDILCEKMKLRAKKNFVKTRRGIVHVVDLPIEKQNELIKQNPTYGKIVCRCERVTEGEILDAIHSPLGARTLDAVKRRTRAGMGRCQAGFCMTRVMEILHRELGIPYEELAKNSNESKIIFEKTKAVCE